MACVDKSTTFLKGFGYNVVKHPKHGIEPLELLGRQRGAVIRLGTLDQLIRGSDNPLPSLTKGEPASRICGQRSSNMNLGIGANILGAIVGAMGGNLGVNLSYTNAKRITFIYENVLSDRVTPLDVGDYLRNAVVNGDNLILQEYVLGHGQLFLITETIRSNMFLVHYHAAKGTELKVDVPAIKGLVGGDIAIKANAAGLGMVSFTGPESLTFGFKCLRVGVKDGDLSLTSSRAGNTALEAMQEEPGEEPQGAILNEDGLLDLAHPGERPPA